MDGINELKKKGTKTMANDLPTTMEYFDNLLGEQLTDGGGGGGSSDFSTAEVTIINNKSIDGYIKGAFTIEADGGFPASSLYNAYYEPNETKTENLVLYKGGAVIEIQGTTEPSISGNIESMGDHMYLVTGDCTITIS